MKILVVTHYYSTHAGGIEIVAGILAKRLSDAHHVTWAASDCDRLPSMGEIVALLPMRSLNVIERLTGLPFPLWGPGSLRRLWRACGSADVVHLHDAIYFGNWAAFAFARLRRRPVLITQHAGLIRYPNRALRAALGLMHRTAVRALLGRAERVVFISPVVRDYFQRFVTFLREPEIVRNGVDTDTYRPATETERAQARARFDFAPNERVVLFVGRFVQTKGLPTIERLASHLTDVTFALAGWGPINPRDWKAPNVRVFDSLRGPTLVPLYQAADLLILPSLGEGLPLVVQEALACGTPALVDADTAAAIAAPPDVVFACAAGGQGTIRAWTATIRQLLSERIAGDERRMQIARFAKDAWSWQAAAERYSEFFMAVADAPRGSSPRP
jgi:glycosyltransferase involved in cell wall biosynthesis